jgi:hypothetical protein
MLNFISAFGLGVMLVNIVGLVITPDFTMSLLHAMWFVVGLLICLVSWDYL